MEALTVVGAGVVCISGAECVCAGAAVVVMGVGGAAEWKIKWKIPTIKTKQFFLLEVDEKLMNHSEIQPVASIVDAAF